MCDQPNAVVDLVQYAEGAPPRGVNPFEFVVQRIAGAMWVLRERPRDELDDRCGDTFGQLVLDGAARAGCNPEPVWLGHR